MKPRTVRRWIFAALALGLVLQLVPYGHDRSNPPVTGEPDWSDARTRELFYQACRDCHTNQTEWPWYARVAPASWLVRWDVEEGRSHFNASEWEGGGEHDDSDEAAEMVRSGEMPLPRYLWLHPEARLSEAEREALARGLEATFPDADDEAEDHRGHEHEH